MPALEAPISDEQNGILIHEAVEGANPGYRIAHVLDIEGHVPPQRLRRALKHLAARHDCLRSSFVKRGDRFERLVHERIAIDVDESAADGDRRRAIGELVDAAVQAGFDVLVPPLWRARILNFGDGSRALVVVVHHAIADGWSLGLLMDELVTCVALGYENLDEPVAYEVYIAQQRARGETSAERGPEPHGGPEADPIWPDVDADAGADAMSGDRVERRLDAGTTDLLRAAPRRFRATPNAILLAAWILLLARYNHGRSVPVTVTFALRHTRALERIVGPCYASVPLHVPVDETETFAAQVDKTWQALAAARQAASRGIPTPAGRRGTVGPTSFTVHPGGRTRRRVAELTFEHGDWPVRGSVGDADVFAYQEDAGWRLLMSFRRRRMGKADAEAVLAHFESLLRSGLRSPDVPVGAFPLQDGVPDLCAKAAWRFGPRMGSDRAGLVERFTARAIERPDDIAILYGRQSVTRAETLDRARRLAEHLRAAGARPGQRIGIHAPRSPAMAVAQLAVRMVGGSFVPLDPNGPGQRRNAILENAGIRLVVETCETSEAGSVARIVIGLDGRMGRTHFQAQGLRPVPGLRTGRNADGTEPSRCPGRRRAEGSGSDAGSIVPGAVPDEIPPATQSEGSTALERCADRDQEAYVLYTSGSTGTPKGVSCTEGALLRQIGATGAWTVGSDDVVLACAPVTFDVSVFEIWNGLLAAARLAIFDEDNGSVEGLGRFILESEVTFALIVPRLFHDLIVRCDGVFRRFKHLLVGGDVNSTYDFGRCRALYPDLTLVAAYGPTETGVTATGWILEAGAKLGSRVPIGLPLAGARVAVVDRCARPLPPGLPGELVIGGEAVELGYVADPALTAARFKPDPIEAGRRSYWTGDIVKMDRDGVLDFLGRSDRQIKIGGYRIEPAEVEAAALASGRVDACAVALRPLPGGAAEIAAALVPKRGQDGDGLVAAVRQSMSERLPGHMIPARFCILEAIPVTAHGKTDFAALLARMAQAPQAPARATGLSELVVNIAAAVLGHSDVSAETNFFAAGGHSLAAIDFCRRLSAATDCAIPLRIAFDAGSLGAIAARVDQLLANRAHAVPLPPLKPANGPVPASLAQKRLIAANQNSYGEALPVVPLAFMLHAPVDRRGLQRALKELVFRHPVLACHFSPGANGQLFVRRRARMPVMTTIDLAATPGPDRLEVMQAACRRLLSVRNDVLKGPPLRCVLFLCPPEGAVLLLLVDHVAHDGRSIAILGRDLMRAYHRGVANRPEPSTTDLTFLDYAAWEAKRLKDGTIDRLARAAAARYGDRGAPLWSPQQRVASQKTRRARVTLVKLPCGEAAFRAYAQRLGVTTFAAVLAVVLTALARCTGVERPRVAVQSSTRIDARLFEAVGPFMNTGYLDVPTNGPIEDVARAVQRELLAAQDFALVPIGHLLDALMAARHGPAAAVMSDVFFSLYDDHSPGETPGPDRIEALDTTEGWDPVSFFAGNPLTILSALDARKLTVRFGLHPAVSDGALGEAFAAALLELQPVIAAQRQGASAS